ncbi:signal peptide peptidase SppA [Novacetimonas hansenii]|uniref:signal peptide peptidase SppA n=1 Tax=Novacetimonas hansenii TaxID=436 RepID=UPI00177F488F|nr:signal peptide peptidase SppA [Novacetimonas hansenii]QOF96234.1 signal peptide peptidase SppA [Novacetimonas hansenii]
MAFDADLALERLSLRRRLILWRVVAVAMFACGLLAISGRGIWGARGDGRDHLVRLRIDGVVGSDTTDTLALIRRARSNPAVKGMLLDINTPGGAVTGGETLHDAIAEFARQKPVAVSMGSLAASAGYMIAVPAQRLFAHHSTLTGSIGVIMQAPDVSGLLDKVGVRVDQLVSGPMKGQPSAVQPLSPQGREMLQGVIADLYDMFVTMVAQGRHLPREKVLELADGRPYTGSQALSLGLVDQIGGEEEAKEWLIRTLHLSETVDVEDMKPRPSFHLDWMRHLLGSVMGIVAESDRLDGLFRPGGDLDGAVAIWKP